jgi:hypothetical protein
LNAQYLALEATLTVVFSLAVAIGVITSFTSLRSSVEGSVADTEAEIIQSELRSGINRVKGADSGSVVVDLPDSLGDSQYTATISGDVLRVSSDGSQYSYSSGQLGETYDLSGSAPGGTVTLSKTGNSIRLASGR